MFSEKDLFSGSGLPLELLLFDEDLVPAHKIIAIGVCVSSISTESKYHINPIESTKKKTQTL